MQTPASNPDNSADNRMEPGQQPDNLARGEQRAGTPPAEAGHSSHTPRYGDFGHADTPAASAETTGTDSRPAGTNPGGTAAPSYSEPQQRGSVPQNLDPESVREVSDADYDDQRAGWAKDDPRYGSGTRNWHTEEPANPSAGPDPDNGRKAPNDGSNDNPDEFSALRKDKGAGIPGK